MKKVLLALALAVCMLLSLAAVAGAATVEGAEITLLYDDRKDLAQLLDTEVTSVEVSNETVTSTKVGTTTPDSHVLVYQDGTLYAVGTGTATLTVDGKAYSVTVNPARLSMFLITGHSIGAGEVGNPDQSVAIEPGQAYSSYHRYSMPNAEGGLGWGADKKAGATDNANRKIDAFDAGQAGTTGTGSALAYRWNQLTGEKVWVMNLAVGGSALNEWIPGVKGHHTYESYQYKYESVLERYGYAQTVVANEIAAGHYTLGHQVMFYFSGANFQLTDYLDATPEDMVKNYDLFWGGLKKDLARDLDGDGKEETLEAMGFVPGYWANNSLYLYDKPLNYYMAGSDEYPDVFLATETHRTWITQETMEANFPVPTYNTQKTPVSKPVSLYHTKQGGTSDNSVFCHSDKTHLSQVAYNAIGLNMAERLLEKLDDQEDLVTYGQFYSVGNRELNVVNVPLGETITIVPYNQALNNGISYEVSDNLEFGKLGLKGLALGTGTVVMKNAEGTVLDTLTVYVVDNTHTHCICGGHAVGMTGHTCSKNQEWIAWGDQASELTTLPTTSGYYYLVNDINTRGNNIAAGQSVHLCLNGYTVNSGTARTIYVRGDLDVTDCHYEKEWGTVTSAFPDPYGAVFYQETGNLNIFAGNWKGNGTNCWGGVGLTSANANIYGGNFYGSKVVRTYVSASQGTRDGRGGTLFVLSGTTNIYGGLFQGGKAQNQGGNICVSGGTLNMYGGQVTGGSVSADLGSKKDGSATAGGNLAVVGGTFNMYGGVITGGAAGTANGGNIAVTGGKATFQGTILEGTAAKGGNLYVAAGTVEIAGAAITDGTADNGGSIYLDGQLTISSGTVSGGTATGNGGNIYVGLTGTLNLTDGTVSGGSVNETTGYGGNIYVYGEGKTKLGKANIYGGTVSGGTAYCGGNISVDGQVDISGGVITGGTANTGGNMYVGWQVESKLPYATVNMVGGTIKDGVGTNTAGNVQVMGNMTMTGGVMENGQAKNNGGNLRVFRPGTFTLDGGTIRNGVSTSAGGGNINISGHTPTSAHSNYGTLIIKSGTVSGGRAASGRGGNIYGQHYADIQIQGGTITGGNAWAGGNIAFYPSSYTAKDVTTDRASSLTVTDGVISNGTATTGFGGNVHMATPAATPATTIVEISGGQILGGSAAQGAGIMNIDSGNITISGGLVQADGETIRLSRTAASTVAPSLTISGEGRVDGTGVNLYVDKTYDTAQTGISLSFASMEDEYVLVKVTKEGEFATCDAASQTNVVSAEDGATITYAEGKLTWTGGEAGEAKVGVYSGGRLFRSYATFVEAAAAAIHGGENYYVKLTCDITEETTVDGDLRVDLNGFTLSGITVTGTVYGMDSATDAYKAEGAGKLILASGNVATDVKTTTAQAGAVRRYLAIEEDTGYSFHRFYFGITHITMDPYTAGIGYRATFAGSDAVKNYLNAENGFGLVASVNGVPTTLEEGVVAGFGPDTFAQEGELVYKRVLVSNVLEEGLPVEELEERAKTVISAVSFLQTKNGDVIFSTSQEYDFKSMVEAIEKGFEDFYPEKQQLIGVFYKKFEELMDKWAMPNLHHTGKKFENAIALDNDKLIALLDANVVNGSATVRSLPSGSYYLTEDVNIGKRSIRIQAGAEVSICLAGKTFTSDSNMFSIYGTLNIHDCCDTLPQEQRGKLVSNSTASYAHIFYVFAGAEFNLYGGDLTTTTGAGQAAIGIVSHDSSDTALAAGVMNMYGGHIYGGRVTGGGGALGVYNKATFNMYGGEIYDNHSAQPGGGVYLTSGTVNLQGGTIRDNSSDTNGGNVHLKGTNVVIGEGTVISGGQAQKGGNVYVESAASAPVIDGATIIGGQAQWGGNIYFASGMNTTIRNATITDGSAYYDGGNLYIYNSGTHLIQDSVFEGGVAGNGGNLYLYNDNSKLKDSMTVTLDSTTVTGGEAPGYIGSHFGNKVGGCGGGIYVWNVDLTLTGKMDITGNIGSDMHVAPATQVKVRDLDENATIGVSMTDVGTFLADDSNKDCFFSNSDTREINVVNGKLKLVDKNPAVINDPTTFSVGWSRVDITPQSPVYLDGMGLGDKARDGQKVIHPMYASIIAVADETGADEAVVFVTMDMLYVQKPLWETVAAAIGEQTGLPRENILMMASHTHYGPENDNPHSDNRNHVEYLCTQVTNGVIAALQDLKPATAEAGKAELQNMNFLRRFVFQRADGRIENTTTIRGDTSGTFLDYEDEKDPDIQAIRFVRDDMDILLINWQSHIFSADANNYVDPCSTYDLRNYVEGTNGVTSLFQKKTMCAFVQGAQGNTGRSSAYEKAAYSGRTDYAKKLVEGAIQALANGGKVETGTPKVLYAAIDPESRGWFKSGVAADQRRDVDLFCVSIGDMAFATAPYEMFCTQGLQLKRYVEENDLFDILFVCGITNGEYNYMPSYRAIMLDQGNTEGEDYEVDVMRFIPGTSENFITEHAKMLVELSGKENVPEADFLQDAKDDWANYKYNPANYGKE